ncbi:hypothetical protein [Porphyromonas endodontalis]|nr:hypothetical protein [Porphyromonas endodontalis]
MKGVMLGVKQERSRLLSEGEATTQPSQHCHSPQKEYLCLRDNEN